MGKSSLDGNMKAILDEYEGEKPSKTIRKLPESARLKRKTVPVFTNKTVITRKSLPASTRTKENTRIQQMVNEKEEKKRKKEYSPRFPPLKPTRKKQQQEQKIEQVPPRKVIQTNYKNFYPTGKPLTAYRHYTNYRLAMEMYTDFIKYDM